MKNIFLSDNAIKIYSVLIALLLWIFIVYNQNPERTKVISNVEISYTNADELEKAGLVILKSETPPLADITVKGRRLSIAKVDSSNVSAYVTIPQIRAGQYEAAVNVQLPINDVSVADKKPYTINIQIESLKSVKVPVEVKYAGASKDDKSAVQAALSPQEITLSGPESIIDTVAAASVTLDISDVVDGANQVLKYRLFSKDGKELTNNINIKSDTDSISVIPSVYATKDITIEPKYSSSMPDGYVISDVSVLPAQIRIGSKNLSDLEKIETVYTEPIDISTFTTDKKIAAKLVIPSNSVNVFSVSEAEVNIKVEQIASRTYSIENVVFDNTQSGKIYTADNLPIEITVKGTKTVLDSYTPQAYANAEGLSDGQHTLQLRLNLPQGTYTDENYSVYVTVSDKAG